MNAPRRDRIVILGDALSKAALSGDDRSVCVIVPHRFWAVIHPLVRDRNQTAYANIHAALIESAIVARHHQKRECKMGKGILLWLLGVPIPIIIILALIF